MTTPEMGDQVGPELLRTLRAVGELATVAKERIEDRPGLLKRGFASLGGTLSVLSHAVTVHGWITSPAWAAAMTHIGPILARILALFSG